MSYDVQLEVAPIMLPDGGQREAEPVSALDLLAEYQAIHQPYEAEVWPQAILNERFVHGDQIMKKGEADERIVDEDIYWPAWLTPISRNLLRNPMLTWAARVTERDPATRCWPGEGGPSDIAAAEVGDRVLSYYRQKEDLRAQMVRAAELVQAHGTVGWRCVWDPDGGPKGETDEGVTEPMGDVAYEVVSVFDFAIDPVDNVDEARWVIFRKWKTVNEARRLLEEKGIRANPKVSRPMTAWTQRGDLVECLELWVRPGADGRFPDGLLVQYVGGSVYSVVKSYPYQHGEVPLAVWRCSSKTGYPYGDTHVSDAVPLQNNYNKLHAAMTTITAKSARWLKVILPESMRGDPWNGDDEAIYVKAGEKPEQIRVLTAPPPSPLLVAQIEEHERMIDKVFGVNEAIVGSDASQSKNARHLAYLSQLDAQKQKEARVNLEHAVLRLERQVIRLVQQYVESERIVRLMGPQGVLQEVAFRGADFMGIDVILEPAPGADQSRAAQAQEAEQAAAAGLEDPQRARELRKSGAGETRYEALARRAVQAQAQAAMQGLAVEVDPMVPPEVAVAELQLVMEQAQSADPLVLDALGALLAAYQEAAAAAAQPMPQPGEVQPLEGAPADEPLGSLT